MAKQDAIIVNLATPSSLTQATAWLEEILGRAAIQHLEPLFPGDPDPTVAGLYTLELAPSVSATAALAALQDDEHVQYAHTPATRQPM